MIPRDPTIGGKKITDNFAIFDVEVKYNYRDFDKPNPWDLGFEIGVAWCSRRDTYLMFDNKEAFISFLTEYDLLIGHNILRFDIPLLCGRFPDVITDPPFYMVPGTPFDKQKIFDTILFLATKRSKDPPDKVIRNKKSLKNLGLNKIGEYLGTSKFKLEWDQDSNDFRWGNHRYLYQRCLQDVRIVKKCLEHAGLLQGRSFSPPR